ncbi:sensor histidine kinase [Streptomyces regalis]|uniref:histidine kinase n=1 Tax=Streptomyces regalis TaxID=68262 RepID=A0A101JR70_9ACTN|nr:histidine kinase [Streptomyces regalis]KUL31595.1 histidine kinase [Streptomyces regalis]
MNSWHLIDRPDAPHVRRLGRLHAVGVALMILAAGTDLLEAGLAALDRPGGYGVTPWLQPAAVLPLCLAAVLWPAARRPAWASPALRIAVPAGASVALTVVAVLADWQMAFGLGEVACLLCLLLVAVRSCPGWWAAACGGLCGVAVVALPARLPTDSTGAGGFGPALLFPVMVTVGLGGYLRFLDHRRRVMVNRTRRSERLAMAADLHDFVAHHVTGVLVQAQVAQMMTTDPDQLRPVLRNIETSATEALASMRRTVGLLREAPDDSATAGSASRPLGDLAALLGLVEGFGGPVGPKVVVHRDPAVPDDLPPEVQAAAYRVVQEALTNVRRHAADATEVTVELVHDGRVLTVTVRDDGRGGTWLPQAARGGGFGLVGLTERVTALGGELRTGPRLTAQGWEVTAVLPTASSARA